MITLYIKTHRKTGLKYFGKTTCDDPVSYWGSGKYWRRHLMKHGFEYDTEIYLQSEDQAYITQEALRFSRAYDIVNSDLWANLREENGTDGNPKGNILSQEHKDRIAQAGKGRILSEETRKKLSKAKKNMSKETREKISKSLSGKKKSKEHLKKMSEGNKDKVLSQETREKISASNKGRKFSEEHNEKIRKANEKTWIVIDPDGNERVVVNLMKFCEENNLNNGNMNSVSLGKFKQHKGYRVKRVE